jgi:hypothetical protein
MSFLVEQKKLLLLIASAITGSSVHIIRIVSYRVRDWAGQCGSLGVQGSSSLATNRAFLTCNGLTTMEHKGGSPLFGLHSYTFANIFASYYILQSSQKKKLRKKEYHCFIIYGIVFL